MKYLDTMTSSVTSIREKDERFGPAEELFDRTAKLASIMLDKSLTPYDIVTVLRCMNDARKKYDTLGRDHYIENVNLEAFALQIATDAALQLAKKPSETVAVQTNPVPQRLSETIDPMLGIDLTEGYVYTSKLDLEVALIRDGCFKMYDFIRAKFSDKPVDYTGQSTLTTGVFAQYNLMLYPMPGFHDLFRGIQRVFHTINPETRERHYMQCWLNFYRKGDFIDWHGHWPPEAQSWHGFYCVTGGGLSDTTYRIPPNGQEVVIPTVNDQLVLSKSDGDKHRSSEWVHDDPRITIAFDIVPDRKIPPLGNLNHWIPI
jgi:hypothetical protein